MTLPLPVVVHEEDCALESWGEEASAHVRWRTLFSGERTPTHALTIGIAELPPREPGPFVTHRHAQVEAYYVLSGEGIVLVAGVEHPVRAGSAIYLPGDVEHGAFNTGSGILRLLYVFAADSFDQVEYRFTPAGSDA